MVALSAAPASAATVSQASATALSLELAGTGARDTGTYAVTNNGSTESAEGTNEPLITALGGQKAIHAGTLAQDAVATKDATSAACSGLAGDGATVVAVGSGDCLSGGDNISLDAASLDFADVELVSSGLFQGVDRQLIAELEKVGLSQTKVTDPLSKALKDLLAAMGDPGLHLDLGAVQSSCTADKDKASGDSSLANSRAYITVPTVGDVTLVDLPVDPDVNQKVVTDLTGVTDAILDALRTQFTKALNGALAPANGGLDQLQTQVLDTALGQIESQLAPLEENVLDITLNAQTTSPGAITVTALDAKVLPAAQEFVGGSLAHLTIGTSSCGPNSPIAKTVKNPPKADNPPASVPTVVTAGMESYDDGSAGRIALVTLLLLAAAGAGVATYVRMLRRG
ncbi:LigA [Nocardioidaceae bacterium Broad-1]|nr:LigA [Nocardioidaceae bacterium Broad-1]